MARYSVATPAVGDLHQIWDYYAREASERVADQQLDRLYHRFLLLAEQPYMGVARPELDPEIRSHTVPNTSFIIFYFARSFGIEVARVVHGSRELARLFR